VIDHEALPPELRGRTPEEIAAAWNLMKQYVSSVSSVQHPAQTASTATAAVEEKPLSDLFMEDPERAIAEFNRRTYGPLLEQLASNAVEGIFSSLRTEIPEFKEYEPTVRKIISDLKINPTLLNRNYVEMAYYIARGRKDEERARAAAAAAAVNQTIPPTPQPPPPPEPTLTDLEREVAVRCGFVLPDGRVDVKGFIKWRDQEALYVNAPTEPKRVYGREEGGKS
jgi:hypothetical protein